MGRFQGDQELVTVQEANHFNVQPVTRLVRRHPPHEAAILNQGQRRAQIERRPVPDCFERFALMNQFRLVEIPEPPGYQNIFPVVAEVSNIREHLPDRLAVKHLKHRGVGAGLGAVPEIWSVNVISNSLLTDRGLKVDSTIDRERRTVPLRG